jgi:hypothetical protein
VLTLASSEGLRYIRLLALSICSLGRRDRANGLVQLRVWRAGDDRGDGRIALGCQRIGAHAVHRGHIGGERHMGGYRYGYGLFFAGDGGLQAQLEFRLRRAEERLVDLGLIGV